MVVVTVLPFTTSTVLADVTTGGVQGTCIGETAVARGTGTAAAVPPAMGTSGLGSGIACATTACCEGSGAAARNPFVQPPRN